MDEIAPPRSSKTRKVFEEHNMEHCKDRISNLPDNILLHILSFISTKEAIRTSILSTRWKYLWIFLPIIDLYDGLKNSVLANGRNLELEDSFVMLVSEALFSRDMSCLRKLSLVLSMDVNVFLVKRWIAAAVDHQVEVLFLAHLQRGRDYVLPPSLFTSTSLCTLKLDIHCAIKAPRYVNFSSLQIMHLSKVRFQDDESTRNLFSGCPMLQEVIFFDCDWRNISSITFSIPTLKTFIFHNGNSHSEGTLHCKFMIYAENLESFSWLSFLAVDVILISSRVFKSQLDMFSMDGDDETVSCAFKVLSMIHNVKFLLVSSETLKSLFLAENLNTLPTFTNLTHLRVDSYFAEYAESVGMELIYFLQKLPNLQSLHISVGVSQFALEIVPECIKSSLRAVSILCSAEDEQEIKFLKFLFSNAMALEKVTVFLSEDLLANLGKQEEIRKQLQILRVGLSAVRIGFSLDFL